MTAPPRHPPHPTPPHPTTPHAFHIGGGLFEIEVPMEQNIFIRMGGLHENDCEYNRNNRCGFRHPTENQTIRLISLYERKSAHRHDRKRSCS